MSQHPSASPPLPALPATLSPEAIASHEALWAVRGTISMAPPAIAEAAAWRAALNTAFQLTPEVRALYETRTRATELAGVPVLEVTPRDHEHATHAILYFHGGGFTIGQPADGIAHGLAQATKLTVYSSEYRKAPEHVFPAALDDAMAVYRTVLTRHDAAHVALVGCSAGGGLAISLALRARAQGLPLPGALVGLSPWVDLTRSGDSILHSSPLLEPLGSYDQAGLGKAAAAYAGTRDLRDPAISPLFGDFTRGFPPTLVTTATRDWFLSSSAQLQRTLKRAGVPVELHVWEGLGHAFEGQPIPEAFEAHGYIAEFIRRRLGVAI